MEESDNKFTATTQIAALLVIAEQLAAVAETLRVLVEATREQTAEVKRLADALSANK